MNRIMIIGCGGSGKTTLAKQLHEITNISLVHLDQLYWQSNWVAPEPEVWRQKVKELVE